MARTVLHFVFSPSGAGCLVQALKKAGRGDQVIASFDDLSFGPINPPDPALRKKWIEDELAQSDWIDASDAPERSWDNEAPLPDSRMIAWLTRRSAMEYAGFLDWLWRLGDAPCEVVDLSEVKVSGPPKHGSPQAPRLAISLGMLHHDTIHREKLWDLAEPLQETVRERYRDIWKQLRSENAPLRILDGGELVSVPISFFDSRVTSQMTDQWQNVQRVLGEALVSGPDDCVLECGDVFLLGRIIALVKGGRLELEGELGPKVGEGKVRLPRTQ